MTECVSKRPGGSAVEWARRGDAAVQVGFPFYAPRLPKKAGGSFCWDTKRNVSGHCHVIVKWLPCPIVSRCVVLYCEIRKRKGLYNGGIQGDTARHAPRSLQGLAPARVCGFKSRLRHQYDFPRSYQCLSSLLSHLVIDALRYHDIL
jgi:hypothetical protein